MRIRISRAERLELHSLGLDVPASIVLIIIFAQMYYKLWTEDRGLRMEECWMLNEIHNLVLQGNVQQKTKTSGWQNISIHRSQYEWRRSRVINLKIVRPKLVTRFRWWDTLSIQRSQNEWQISSSWVTTNNIRLHLANYGGSVLHQWLW